eukprot:g12761.t1
MQKKPPATSILCTKYFGKALEVERRRCVPGEKRRQLARTAKRSRVAHTKRPDIKAKRKGSVMCITLDNWAGGPESESAELQPKVEEVRGGSLLVRRSAFVASAKSSVAPRPFSAEFVGARRVVAWLMLFVFDFPPEGDHLRAPFARLLL